jgi:hypothetical protein
MTRYQKFLELNDRLEQLHEEYPMTYNGIALALALIGTILVMGIALSNKP